MLTIRLTLGIIVLLLPTLAHAEANLTFGIYATDRPTEVVRQLQPLINALQQSMQKQLGEKVSIKTPISKTYQDGLDALVSGKVDFSRFGPASYIIAKQQNAGVSLLAMEQKRARKSFLASYWYTVIVLSGHYRS